MAEQTIIIGGRNYEVACQDGEEPFLHRAAALLGAEADALQDQIGRQPEPRTLLMAGLMLADRTTGLQDRLQEAERRLAELSRELDALRARPEPEPVEVPTVPPELVDTLRHLSERSEALADLVEEKCAGG